MQLVAQIRRVRRLIPAARGAGVGRPTTTTTTRANRSAPGTTGPTSTGSSPSWSTTPSHDPRRRSTGSSSTTNRPKRSGCWRWSPAKTSNPATTDGTWRIAQGTARIGWCRCMIPSHATCTRPPTNYRDGFKAHVGVEPDTGLITACDADRRQRRRRPGRPRAARRRDVHRSRCSPTPPTAPASSATTSPTHGHTATIKPIPLRPADPRRVHHRRLRHRHPPPAPSPARPGITVTIRAVRRRPASRGTASAARCGAAAPRSSRPGHHDPPHHDLLAAARAHARPRVHRAAYRQHRPMVERSIAWLVRRRRPQGPLPRHRPQPASASPTAAPRSTCDASSTSASTMATTAGRSAT